MGYLWIADLGVIYFLEEEEFEVLSCDEIFIFVIYLFFDTVLRGFCFSILEIRKLGFKVRKWYVRRKIFRD